jgi:Holliday junction resolvasome RuvABC endonuclease subunit
VKFHRILGIDPGYANCGWCLLENGLPVKYGGWFSSDRNKSLSIPERCLEIARGIQGLVQHLKVTSYAAERWATHGHRRGVSMEVTYNRGVLDGYLKLALGHLPGIWIHSTHLKKWATGSGNANKDMVRQGLKKRLPGDFVDDVLEEHRLAKAEHILEAAGLGMMGSEFYFFQYGAAETSAADKIVFDKMEEEGTAHPPMVTSGLILPDLSRRHRGDF